jgi:hypothetical protein
MGVVESGGSVELWGLIESWVWVVELWGLIELWMWVVELRGLIELWGLIVLRLVPDGCVVVWGLIPIEPISGWVGVISVLRVLLG